MVKEREKRKKGNYIELKLSMRVCYRHFKVGDLYMLAREIEGN
jgi:hypothetical protein